MMNNEKKVYGNCMSMTQQFRHCGNPFRIDAYKGCNFGCKYCFATLNGRKNGHDFLSADIDVIRKNFEKAFESDREYKNVTIELMKHRIPLHLGGLSDPFQSREAKEHITYEIIKLTKKYNYPMMISTKTAHIDDEYFEFLDPNIHAFQISLMSVDEDYIRQFESNTPSPNKRIEFIKKLKEKGFWVGVRLQPMSSLEQGKKVVETLSPIVNFITVEHVKIGNDTSYKKELFKMFNINPEDCYSQGREYELHTEIKRKNIEELKKISKCPIGCGDNDLHEMSDTNNCCGIDTINENFTNWLKYNSMYIKKTGDDTQWYPSNNCHSCFNGDCVKKGFNYKDYVDDYMSKPMKVGKCRVVLD